MKILVCTLLLVAASLAQEAEQDRANLEENVEAIRRILTSQLASSLLGLTPSEGNSLDESTLENLIALLSARNPTSQSLTNNEIAQRQNDDSEAQVNQRQSSPDENSLPQLSANFNALDDPKWRARSPVYTTTAKPITDSNPVNRDARELVPISVNEPQTVPVQVSYLTGKSGSLPLNVLVGLKVPLPYTLELPGSNSAPVSLTSTEPVRDIIPVEEKDPESSEPVVREQRYVAGSPVWLRQQFRRRNSPFLNYY